MSAAVDQVLDRKERPPYVRFERVAVEDKAAGIREGHYVAKDVDFAFITPPYSKDLFKKEAKDWFADMEQQVSNGRLPEAWLQGWRDKYRAWQSGQEIPLHGVPIRGWGVISPAQQETLIRLSVTTVEDLAEMNDEGMRRVGMGAVELRNKARAWLAQLSDKGPLTQEMAALQGENSLLKANLETLTAQVDELRKQVRAASVGAAVPLPPTAAPAVIAASDILDDGPAAPVPVAPAEII